MASYGYAGRILKVDLSSGNITHVPTSKYSDDFLGGRGIGTKLYWDEVSSDIKPLDPENRLIFVTGPTTGVPPAGPRCQVFSKSPVTEKFCYGSFAGKGWGAQLKSAGFDGLVVRGKAEKPVYLSIDDGRAEIKDASALWGKGSVDTSKELKDKLGSKVRVIAVGPAAENCVIFAAMLADGDASVSAGFGAVMGSKNLKAIAVRGIGKIAVSDHQELKQITEYVRQLHGDRKQVTMVALPPDHTHDVCFGCIGCSSRSFYKAKNGIKGKYTCTSGIFYQDLANRYHEKRTEVPFFANRLIDQYGLDSWTMMVTLIMLDIFIQGGIVTEQNSDLPVQELGSLEFIETLVKQISFKKGLGEVLAQGPGKAADHLGKEAVSMVGTLLGDDFSHLSVFDPRMFIYSGLVYAMEPRQHMLQLAEIGGVTETMWSQWANKVPGAFISSEVLRAIAKRFWGGELAVDFSTYEGKALAAKKVQDRAFANECLILCLWNFPVWYSMTSKDHLGDPTIESRIVSAVTGKEISEEQLYGIGEKVYNLQRSVMVREGHRGRESDKLPDHFHTEPLGIGYYNPECTVPGKDGEIISRMGKVLEKDKFEGMKSEFYSLREWDVETGLQTTAKLQELGLKDVADDLEKKGLVV